jgi:ATP-dependent helicase/nuclease subunit A
MFVNDVGVAIDKVPERPDAFRYSDDDAFPHVEGTPRESDALGVVAAETDRAQAEAVAEEIRRLLAAGVAVRDRQTGVRRPIGPGDVGVLFRTREGHALFEAALARRRVPFYVYKGLGFFDAEEVKDVLALVSFFADPASSLRSAAFLRSRFVRLSDEALKLLAPDIARSLTGEWPAAGVQLQDDDRERLTLVRGALPGWIDLADQVPPAELVDRVLTESAYAVEIGGPGFDQARENLKKIRGLIRRIQNRGYATLGRIADYFSGLAAGGDESNAIVDAADAVNLMTVHAAKGLEFPVVFLVNLGKGSGGSRDDIRVVPPPFTGEDADDDGEPLVAIRDHEDVGDREDEKEREETKRLLYVAMTRARDRLYFGLTVTGGKAVLQRGSLGKMLPVSLQQVLAGVGDTPEAWPGPSATHALRRVPVPGAKAI